VSARHFEAGAASPTSDVQFSIDGRLSADGTFDVFKDFPARNGHEVKLIRRRMTFDGHLLTFTTHTAAEQNAYGLEYALGQRLFDFQIVPALGALHGWIVDPFGLPGFASHEYATAAAGGRMTLELPSRSGKHADRRIVVNTSAYPVPVIEESMVFDLLGSPRVRETFGAFREVAPGVWRPFWSRRELLLQGVEQSPRVVTEIELSEARELSAAECTALSAPRLEEELPWNVWF
jgi:hypothetical protein